MIEEKSTRILLITGELGEDSDLFAERKPGANILNHSPFLEEGDSQDDALCVMDKCFHTF
jgi:hypothetical protein